MTTTTRWATVALDAPSKPLTTRPGLVSVLSTGDREYVVAIFEVEAVTASRGLDVVAARLDDFALDGLASHDTLEDAERGALALLRRYRTQQAAAKPEPTELEEILIAKDVYLDNRAEKQKWGELTYAERMRNGNAPPMAWVPIVKALRAARGL